MCGIVGLYLKNSSMENQLGALFAPMLIEMTDRGPDSAGLAIYNHADSSATKFTAFHPYPDFNWNSMAEQIAAELGAPVTARKNESHCVLLTNADLDKVTEYLESYDSQLQIMSYGHAIEIYKETGLPAEVARRFDLTSMSGSHIIGHTRMATESAVTTDGAHPFSTGADLCLVHNGSLSNHNNLREWLHNHKDVSIRTENDTEVGAAYIASRMKDGRSLHEALEDCIEALDGFYTFVAGTKDGFAVLRDPIACKPAVLAETDDYVAFASEYRSLVSLPGIEDAKVWEPEPAIVYSWGGSA